MGEPRVASLHLNRPPNQTVKVDSNLANSMWRQCQIPLHPRDEWCRRLSQTRYEIHLVKMRRNRHRWNVLRGVYRWHHLSLHPRDEWWCPMSQTRYEIHLVKMRRNGHRRNVLRAVY